MERKKYTYFKRDVSWLSFNYRVLLEAADETFPVYERLHFLSIYASNLEEFYEIRVAEHRGIVSHGDFAAENADTAVETLEEIATEVNRQQEAFYRIFYESVLPELHRRGIYLYRTEAPAPFHEEFVRNYFAEEVFPFLTPVPIEAGLRTFIRDRRLYLVVRLRKKTTSERYCHMLIKIPHAKVPRFVALPSHDDIHYYMFSDDVIRHNLSFLFPGYEIGGCYSIQISRDADICLEEENPENMLRMIRRQVGKRKIGALSRFIYDRAMPRDFLEEICKAFGIRNEDLVTSGRYMNLQDLDKLPNPVGATLRQSVPQPMRVPYLERAESIFHAVEQRDVLLHFPYQSFDYLIRFLAEAASDPATEEIKITQYRAAENSEVIRTLIHAAKNGKKVTVFVELKARFDEVNNLSAAEQMEKAGIRIIYSLPGLKVHAKVAVILRKAGQSDFACLSTGNFNEKTATIYADMALLTCDRKMIDDISRLFSILEGESETSHFHRLLVARFNMVPELIRMIRREINHVKAGKSGRIILKMNGLHDEQMIDELYRASEHGVEIDLIVRGACCLMPGRPYSRHIRITRIVDMFLEHARVWYFHNGSAADVYLASADWMNRNLHRRIETAFPILTPDIRQEIIDMLHIQLRDNVKACFIDDRLRNVFKKSLAPACPPVRAQETIREYIRKAHR